MEEEELGEGLDYLLDQERDDEWDDEVERRRAVKLAETAERPLPITVYDIPQIKGKPGLRKAKRAAKHFGEVQYRECPLGTADGGNANSRYDRRGVWVFDDGYVYSSTMLEYNPKRVQSLKKRRATAKKKQEKAPLKMTLFRDLQTAVRDELQELPLMTFGDREGLTFYRALTVDYRGVSTLEVAIITLRWMIIYRKLGGSWKRLRELEPVQAAISNGQAAMRETIKKNRAKKNRPVRRLAQWLLALHNRG
jgi:hypothetical protein